MGKSKIIFAGETLIDLTGDSVDPSKLLVGATAHDKAGEEIEGECTYDSDTTDATAVAAEILSGKTGYVNKSKVTGTMANNGAVAGVISEKDEKYTVPVGFHDGGGKVGIADAEKAKLVAENIRKDIEILGVTGTMTGTEDVNAETKEVTPTKNAQVIVPDTANGYNYIGQVNVAGIPYTETPNGEGKGTTVTIG